MVALNIVKISSARLKDLGPNMVEQLEVGGTSEFVRNTITLRDYLIGRNGGAAHRIIPEFVTLNKEAKVEFVKANATELAEVDRVCDTLIKEKSITLIIQSQGNLTLKGRDESPERLDRIFTLNFYSHMRILHNPSTLLQANAQIPPQYSRSVSILGAGHDARINSDDLDLKTCFSPGQCANHTIVMNDFMAEEFSKRNPGTTYNHSFPSVVNTGISREMPVLVKWSTKIFMKLAAPLLVGEEETGARQLFIATSGVYSPKQTATGDRSAGMKVPDGLKIMTGSDGTVGSGGYIVNWNNEITGKQSLLNEYRAKDTGNIVWDHTMSGFERVQKLNRDKSAPQGSST
ncbi:hypothetical protein BJ878DRAFT_583620 [Calycina marina]|uniref:Uncharacterized protein n=1 Tax=Calycina marina TaxID=1763456 RepID=A0A9P7Z0T7_9HELO|nr:hypothetical protein BJ878DRAFT_583620 [Calycina marina]